MPTTDLLLNNALIVALGWTLVHFLWQGCVIAFVFWLICLFSPRHATTLRYWAGLSGMLLSLLAVLLTFAISYAPEARFSIGGDTPAAVNPFLVLSGRLPDGWVLLEAGIEPVLPWIVLLWFSGVLLSGLSTVREWLGVRRLLHDGIVATEVQLQLAMERIKAKLDVQLPVRLLASTRVLVPLAIGCLRPVILMPVGVLARLPQDQLEMILAHELGHIRRFDYLFNLLQVAMENLLFYHPAIGWMSRRIREEREHCCDDLVVRVCGRPATYARALANLEVIRSPAFMSAIPATGGNLLARIKLIIDEESPGKRSVTLQFAVAAVAGLMVAFGAQQGYSLSTELNRVAFSAQLQGSDVQWKTWARSREAWGKGVEHFGQSARKQQLVKMKSESLSLRHLPEPQTDFQAIANPVHAVESQLAMQQLAVTVGVKNETFDIAAEMLPTAPMTLNPPADLLVRPDDSQPGFKAEIVQLQAASAARPGKPSVSQRYEALAGNATVAKIVPLKSRPPNYPWQARRQGIEGFVELEFSVNSAGKVTHVEVLDALPEGVFEKAASRALSRWTFAAKEHAGSRFRQVFDFELQDVERGPPRSRICAVTGSRTCGIISPDVFVVWVNETTPKTKEEGLN
jgi:TonB family protein